MKHSVLCLSSVLIALISSVCNSSAMALDPPSHDTLAYTHELKPIPQAYQLARATFLPEASKTDFKFSGNTTEGDYNQATSCEDKSKLYTTSNCKYPRAVVAASRCPFLAGYYTECKCLSQFNKTSCTAPYILGGTSCDGKYEKCVCPATVSLTYANDKCTQYCDGSCIKKTCSPEPNQSNCTNGMQNCDNRCGQNTRKCCIACTHKITTKPANSSYTYSSCNDGSGSHQIQTGWKCNPGYHEKNGDCEKDCIANTCSGYTLAGCPTTAICATCSKQTTTCGGGATMNKITGCKSGYHLSGSTCVAHSYSCPSGYQASACSSSQVQTGTTSKKCSCGATSGTCYACRAKTCEEQGKKTCNGSCIAKSSCCGGCSSGYKCDNGSCVPALAVGDILYADKSTSSLVNLIRNPIGVVISTNPKVAIALEEYKENYPRVEKYCSNYNIFGVSGWRVPSQSEMQAVYNNRYKINGTLADLHRNAMTFEKYWTSTTYSGSLKYIINLNDGSWGKKSSSNASLIPLYVRCAISF